MATRIIYASRPTRCLVKVDHQPFYKHNSQVNQHAGAPRPLYVLNAGATTLPHTVEQIAGEQ